MSGYISTRVANGAALLDEKCPGWDERIEIDEVDLFSVTDCVLGQLYGHYSPGVRRLKLDGDGVVAYGFASARGPGETEQLQEEWKRLVTERRATST